MWQATTANRGIPILATTSKHIRTEHSTFRWLFEPMLTAGRFEIVTVDFDTVRYTANIRASGVRPDKSRTSVKRRHYRLIPVARPGYTSFGCLRKDPDMPVINTIELEGVSTKSWGDAARDALREAAKTIRNINRLEVLSTGTSVADGLITEYRTQVRLYFVVDQGR